MFSPRGQKLAVGVEYLHAVIGLIGDINAAVSSDSQPTGIIKFSGTDAGFSPFVEELAGRAVYGDAVGVDLFIQYRPWKVAEIEISMLCRDAMPPGLGSTAKWSKSFPARSNFCTRLL